MELPEHPQAQEVVPHNLVVAGPGHDWDGGNDGAHERFGLAVRADEHEPCVHLALKKGIMVLVRFSS